MLKFHGYFGDGAVIQRNRPVVVTGYSDGPTTVSLEGGGLSFSVRADSDRGRFRAEFSPIDNVADEVLLTAACGGDEVGVRVRFGDVFLAMGQSNMSYVLSATENYERWVDMAARAKISVLSIDEKPFRTTEELTRSYEELSDFPLSYAWRTGGSTLLPSTSAISVQFAVYLWQRTGVPVGVVHTATGGLSVDSYLKRSSVERDGELAVRLVREERYVGKEEWNKKGLRNYTQTSCIWNERIAPLYGLSFAGALWYLGESSAFDYSYAQTFSLCLSAIVRDLRDAFGKLPFVAVNIAPEYYPYGDGFGYEYVNEAICDLENAIDDVSVIPVYDVEPRWLGKDGAEYYHPIHTVNKEPVSERICEAIRGFRPKYPHISGLTEKNGKLYAKVENVVTSLRRGALNGFTVAGETGKYYPARARAVSDDVIEIFSEDVRKPVRATYAFMQYCDFCNAKTIDGAPLLPYRSERGPVTDDYCFPPAFLTPGADSVYENNFGYTAGTCRKVPVWGTGKIYRGATAWTEVRRNGVLLIKGNPGPGDYKFFGVSPEICLSGHKNHLADYDYLSFGLRAKDGCSFYGVVCKCADGSIYRYDLFVGGEKVESVPLGDEVLFVSADLKNASRGDGAPVVLTDGKRKTIAFLEFLFRSDGPARVAISDLRLTDLLPSASSVSGKREGEKREAETRADIALPEGPRG